MRIALGLFALLGLATSGCRVYVHEHERRQPDRVVVYEDRHDDPVGTVVVIDRGHVHSEHCGHYWYNGRWYHHTAHRHGQGCGHVYHDGAWVLAVVHREQSGHVHSANCGHYHHNGSWYYMRGHVHGAGCGHRWDGRVWIAVRW